MARPERAEDTTTQAGRDHKEKRRAARQTRNELQQTLQTARWRKPEESPTGQADQQQRKKRREETATSNAGRSSVAAEGAKPEARETTKPRKRSHIAWERDSDRAREEDPTRAGPRNVSPRRREREAEDG